MFKQLSINSFNRVKTQEPSRKSAKPSFIRGSMEQLKPPKRLVEVRESIQTLDESINRDFEIEDGDQVEESVVDTIDSDGDGLIGKGFQFARG